MGVVYKARHLKLNRVVALKMVRAGGHAGSEELLRFLAEAEAVAALQHPNIVQVFEFGQQDGLALHGPGVRQRRHLTAGCVTACRAEGGGLAGRATGPWHGGGARQGHHPSRPEASKCPAGRSGSQDPKRLALIATCTPKVTDFGLAKKVEGGSGLTQTGAVMGTPSYMAPEQAEGKKDVGPAADVYALGAHPVRVPDGPAALSWADAAGHDQAGGER